MKNNAIIFAIWLLLVYATTEINISVFNFIFYSKLDSDGFPVLYGNPWLELLACTISFATFGAAGWIIAWKVRERFRSVVSAVLVATFSLGIEYSFSIPWFLLMPSHPAYFDRFIAFLGPSIPPLAAVVGVSLFCKIYGHNNEANAH